jgi:hypothetical protein
MKEGGDMAEAIVKYAKRVNGVAPGMINESEKAGEEEEALSCPITF